MSASYDPGDLSDELLAEELARAEEATAAFEKMDQERQAKERKQAVFHVGLRTWVAALLILTLIGVSFYRLGLKAQWLGMERLMEQWEKAAAVVFTIATALFAAALYLVWYLARRELFLRQQKQARHEAEEMVVVEESEPVVEAEVSHG